MDLACPACNFATAVPDTQLPPEGTRARCPSCQRVSVYLRGGLVDDDPTPPESMQAVAPAGSFAPHAAPPPPPPAGGWRFRTVAGEEGPYDLETAKSLVRTGSLHPDDQAMAPGDSEWRRAGDLPALARYFKLRHAAGAPPATGPAACFKHPRTQGTWLCSGCGTLSCSECVVEQELQRVRLKICPRCKKPVTELVATKIIVPFWKEIPALLVFPVRRLGWLAMIFCSIAGAAACIAGKAAGYGMAGKAVLTLSIYAYHLLIIKHSSTGRPGLPNLGGVENIVNDLLKPGGKASFVTLLVFLGPGLLMGMWAIPAAEEVAAREFALANAAAGREAAARGDSAGQPGWTSEADEGDTAGDGSARAEAEGALFDHLAEMGAGDEQRDAMGLEDARNVPEIDWDQEVRNAQRALDSAESAAAFRAVVAWALILLAATLWPLLLIIVALFNTVMPVFQPQVLLKIIREIQQEYSICVIFTLVLLALAQAVSIPLVVASEGLFSSLANPLAYYFSFMAFHVMGRTAEMAEQKIDWS